MSRSDKKGRIPDEAKLGFAFLLAIIVFVYGLFFLKDIRITGGRIFLTAQFQNVGGVGNKDPVLLGGVKIGQVVEVGIDHQIPYAIMRIEDLYPIPDDSYVEAMDRSVMGEKAIEIHRGVSTRLLKSGDRIEGRTALGLLSMVSMADSVSGDLRTLITSANAMLDPEMKASVKKSLTGVQEVSDALKTTLNQERVQLHRVMAHLDSLVTTAHDISEAERGKISSTLSNLEKTSAQMGDMITQLQSTTTSLETILQRLERGEGTIGKLLTDDKLYTNMDRLMTNLDGLVMDLKNNPKRYLNISIF